MAVMDFSKSLGLERIGKEAIYVLRRELNDEIRAVNASWTEYDKLLGFDPVAEIELVEKENFFHGHVPSLIEAPPGRFPNVSALAFRSQPALESGELDHENVYTDTLYVEVMCKSWDNEVELNSRTLRTVDAIFTVLSRIEVLGGTVMSQVLPTTFVTDVGHRPETRGHGRSFFFQGARLEYSLNKYVDLTDSRGA